MTTDFRTNLYQYLADYIAQNNNSPSFGEMTQAMGISPHSKSLISRSLQTLKKEGKLILKKQGRRLLISLVAKHLPLLGKISAGMPIEAISHHQHFDIENLFIGENRFALQIKGTSMIEDGILDGDIIICKRADTANENDIIVALIDQHNTTLKRISYKMKGMITLIPANAELKPRAYLPERIQVQGIYIGLVRMQT